MNTFPKNFFKLALIFTLVLCLFSIAYKTYAIDDYTVLSPLPGTTNCTDTKCTTNFQTYLPGLFNFSIGIAAVMAFAVISYGGFVYATTDSIWEKQEGQKYIWNAVKGLLLVIGAYAILYTINPQILDFNLSPTPPKLNLSPDVNVVTPIAGNDFAADAAMRTKLSNDTKGVITEQNNACTANTTTACVNVNGLTNSTVTGLENLATACNAPPTSLCYITISGGTEGGHSVNSAHATGNAVDILPDSNMNKTITNGTTPSAGQRFSYGGGTYTWEPKGCCGDASKGIVPSSGNHWHASFP